MRDPIDELENFDPGPAMTPMPAADVRRRGDRIRRRNNTVAAVGGIAAVAVLAVPFAVFVGGSTPDSTPPPATQDPSPTVTVVTEIPGDFPLTGGLPTPVTTEETYRSPVTDVCDGSGWDANGATDVRQATYTESEGGSTHTLALYPTEGDASMALLSSKSATQACALETEGRDRWLEVLPSNDATLVYANHYSDGGDLDTVQLVQVGNALLQATTYSLGTSAQDSAQLVAQRAAPVVDAMCAFSPTGCGETAEDSGTVSLSDVPLLDGLPTRAATADFGRYGPGQDEKLLTIPGCGDDTLPTPEPVDWLRAGWRDPAEARDRQVVVYSSAEEAAAYVDAFGDLATCVEEDLGDGVVRIHSGAGSDLGLGDQASIAIIWHRIDGRPATGFRITEVVRVGSAVVVQDRVVDGLDDKVTSAYLEQIIAESDQSLVGVVDGM